MCSSVEAKEILMTSKHSIFVFTPVVEHFSPCRSELSRALEKNAKSIATVETNQSVLDRQAYLKRKTFAAAGEELHTQKRAQHEIHFEVLPQPRKPPFVGGRSIICVKAFV